MVEALRSVEDCVFRVVYRVREGTGGRIISSLYFDISSFLEILSLFINFRMVTSAAEEGATVFALGSGKIGGDHGGSVWCSCLASC